MKTTGIYNVVDKVMKDIRSQYALYVNNDKCPYIDETYLQLMCLYNVSKYQIENCFVGYCENETVLRRITSSY